MPLRRPGLPEPPPLLLSVETCGDDAVDPGRGGRWRCCRVVPAPPQPTGASPPRSPVSLAPPLPSSHRLYPPPASLHAHARTTAPCRSIPIVGVHGPCGHVSPCRPGPPGPHSSPSFSFFFHLHLELFLGQPKSSNPHGPEISRPFLFFENWNWLLKCVKNQ
jgi:hypothetical protein